MISTFFYFQPFYMEFQKNGNSTDTCETTETVG